MNERDGKHLVVRIGGEACLLDVECIGEERDKKVLHLCREEQMCKGCSLRGERGDE